MALPLSRNRTYANGDPIIPGDLNDLMDQAIAIHGGRHAVQPIPFGPGLALIESGPAPSVHSSRELTWPSLTSARRFSIPLSLRVGQRITTWRLTCTVASGTWAAVIERVPELTPGSPVPLVTVPTISAGGMALGAVNHTVLANNSYNLNISTGASAAAITFTLATLDIDHL